MNKKYAPTLQSSLETKYAYFAEEVGEALQALGKVNRFGLDSTNPDLPENDPKKISNREYLKKELSDVKHAILLIELSI